MRTRVLTTTVEARPYRAPADLVTVEWARGSSVAKDGFKGAFVRLVLPADASPEEREEARRQLLEIGGARVVRLAPKQAGAAEVPEPEKGQPPPARTVREVVGALVEEVPSEDRAALRAEVGAAMTEAGL